MKTINHYILQEEIGQGGMSKVYRAYDPNMERQVAIKLMSEELSRNEKARERFVQEAKMVMAMEHPAIVPVWDHGEIDGRLYIVMPYMPGGSLREKLEQGAMPFEDSIVIIERIAWALDSAHEEHIIHRDVKPHNILLDELGQAYLADFGVARLMDEDGEGKTITMVGTPEFIAPEQALEGKLTFQADVYQLGVTLFCMLTGQQPFNGSSFKLIAQHVSQPVPSVEALNPSLPIGADTVIRQAMAKNPMDRYPTAGALAMALVDLNVESSATRVFVMPQNLESAEVPPLPLLETVEHTNDGLVLAAVENESLNNSGHGRRWLMTAVLLLVLAVGSWFTFSQPQVRRFLTDNVAPIQQLVEGEVDAPQQVAVPLAAEMEAAEIVLDVVDDDFFGDLLDEVTETTADNTVADDTAVTTEQADNTTAPIIPPANNVQDADNNDDNNNGGNNNNGNGGNGNNGGGGNDGNGGDGNGNGGRRGGNNGNGGGGNDGNGGDGNGNGGRRGGNNPPPPNN